MVEHLPYKQMATGSNPVPPILILIVSIRFSLKIIEIKNKKLNKGTIMSNLIEPTDTLLTLVIAGIVFVLIILALGILLRIGIGPVTMLASFLSNVLERILNKINKYFVNFINLVVLSTLLNRIPKLLNEIKISLIQQQCRVEFQTRGVDDFYSNFPDVQLELDKVAANIDLFYKALPFIFIGCLIFDIYAQRKNFLLREKLNAANLTGSWAKKDSYDFIVTSFDRLYSAGFYSLPILDVYNRYAQSFFTLYPSYWPCNFVFQTLHKIMYEDLQSLTFGLFLTGSFFFLFYGIGRNRDNFTFFIRYHAVQSVSVSILLGLYNTFFKFILYLQPEHGLLKSCFWEADTAIVCCLIITPMVLSAIIGIESRFPGLDEAILYHVGVRPPKKRPPENIDENL